MRKFAPVLSRFALFLLCMSALILVGCMERSALEGYPPQTLRAPSLPTVQLSASATVPSSESASAPTIVDQIIVSATVPSDLTAAPVISPNSTSPTATLIIPPPPSSTPAGGVTISGTAETIIALPTRTPVQILTQREILSATLQALTALNNPTPIPPITNAITSTVPTPTPSSVVLATSTPLTTTDSAAGVVVTSTEQPLPTVTPLPTVPTATPIPIVTITPQPDKSNLYVVGEGETLESIGTEWGVPTGELAAANALPITAVLTQGQPIVIPIDKIIVPTPTLIVLTATPALSATITSTETTTDTADSPPPTVDETGEDIPETQSPPPSDSPPPTSVGDSPYDPNDYFIHTVQSGETIYRIAITYGFTEEELIAYNQLEYNDFKDNYLIYPGDELRVPRK